MLRTIQREDVKMYLESTNKKKYNKKMKILEHICGFDEHTFIKNTVVWRRASSSIFSLFLQSNEGFLINYSNANDVNCKLSCFW